MTQSIVNVARFLPEMALKKPDSLSVKVPRGRLSDGSINYLDRSYLELDRESDAVVRFFTERGIRQGHRVLLMVKPGLDLIQITFALFKMGAVPVVIDPGMGLKNFLHCVTRTTPDALVGIPLAHWIASIFRKPFQSVRFRIKAGNKTFSRSIARFTNKSNTREPLASTRENDLAAILFTSGSTGPPKGVCYEHGMFEAQVNAIRELYDVCPGEVDLPMLPVFALFGPAFGMTCVVPEMNPSRPATVNPANIVDAILQCKVTNTFGSPVLWGKIGRYCLEKKIRLPSIKRILVAGAPVPPSLIRMFREIIPQADIHTPYGATECLPVSSISGSEVLGDTWKLTGRGEGTCVGRLAPGIDAKVIRIDDGPLAKLSDIQELPHEEIGEIMVKGAVVTRKYDRVPDETAKAKVMDTDGKTVWHRIGDLGYIDQVGRLWFCGRKAERVRTEGGDKYTDCCEAIFNRHPMVFRSALIGLSSDGGEIPAIVVEPEPEKWPRTARAKNTFTRELKTLAQTNPLTREIEHFFYYRHFPVDVRHNAKIHRKTLARYFNRKYGTTAK